MPLTEWEHPGAHRLPGKISTACDLLPAPEGSERRGAGKGWKRTDDLWWSKDKEREDGGVCVHRTAAFDADYSLSRIQREKEDNDKYAPRKDKAVGVANYWDPKPVTLFVALPHQTYTIDDKSIGIGIYQPSTSSSSIDQENQWENLMAFQHDKIILRGVRHQIPHNVIVLMSARRLFGHGRSRKCAKFGRGKWTEGNCQSSTGFCHRSKE
jgi:hypothetical protein